jgi:hypothetical protein
MLAIVITDSAGRRIAFPTDDGRMLIADTRDTTLHGGDIVVREADAFGPLGQDAFRQAAKLFREAKQAIAISQLFFPLSEVFKADANQEATRLIFDFAGTQPDAHALIAGAVKGDRPEHLLLDAANERGVDARIVLNNIEVPLFIKIALGALVAMLAADGTNQLRRARGVLLNRTSRALAPRPFGLAAARPTEAKVPHRDVNAASAVPHYHLAS